MHPEAAPTPNKSKHPVVMTVDDALVRLRDLNALEGFERWRLKVLEDGKYQVLELDASGRVRWQSFRRENIRVVVGWAAQQTNKRKAALRQALETAPQVE
jgi:hypothetical protein